MVPEIPSLFEAVQHLEQTAHLVLSARECKAQWLSHVDDLSELCIEVGVLHIHLMYIPVIVCGEG